MDYCDKPVELQANPDAKRIFEKIAAGDKNAYSFMWSFWNFTHIYDDLVDNDKAVTPSEAAGELAQFITMLTMNPFYQKFGPMLLPLIITACDRWVVGDFMTQSENLLERERGRVVRCGDLDVYAMVAYLVGGWSHMRVVSEELRTYDH